MTTLTADARRAAWRADLLEHGANGLRKFGDTTNADTKVAEAALHREFAMMTDNLHAARTAMESAMKFDKAAGRMLCSDPKLVEAERAAQLDIAHAREYWANVGAASGTFQTGSVVNNFMEPSDEELIGLGY